MPRRDIPAPSAQAYQKDYDPNPDSPAGLFLWLRRWYYGRRRCARGNKWGLNRRERGRNKAADSGGLALVGFGMMLSVTPCNTALQTIVDDDKRGRVMSFFTMAFFGTMPFGSLLGGSLAHLIGAPETIMIGGISCILGSFLFATKLSSFRRLIHPIYVKKGIILEEQTEISDQA